MPVVDHGDDLQGGQRGFVSLSFASNDFCSLSYRAKDSQSAEKLIANYMKATDEGILKVLSKMGVSTLASYKGAQLFEILGLHEEVVGDCFVGTASRVQGATYELLAMDAFEFHERAWPTRDAIRVPGMVSCLVENYNKFHADDN